MTLVGTELWERFSYYGMRAILLYFITDTLANGGLGIDRSTGVAITSIYGASVYLLSVVGGWLADRMIGARRATLYGGLVIALGHVLLAVPMTALAGDAEVSSGVLVGTYAIQTIGELFLSPAAFRSQAMALWFLAPRRRPGDHRAARLRDGRPREQLRDILRHDRRRHPRDRGRLLPRDALDHAAHPRGRRGLRRLSRDGRRTPRGLWSPRYLPRACLQSGRVEVGGTARGRAVDARQGTGGACLASSPLPRGAATGPDAA